MTVHVGLGHNGAPIKDLLCLGYTKLQNDVAEAVASASRAPITITDDVTLGKFGDLIKTFIRLGSEAEKSRKGEKEPFLVAGRDVDAFFAPICANIDTAKKTLLARQTAYLSKKEAEERARQAALAKEAQALSERALEQATAMQDDSLLQAAVEAETKAAEASTLAAAPTAELVRTHSAGGSVSTLKKEWVFAVDDYALIPLDTIRPYLAADAIDKAIRAAVKAGTRKLAGVRIFEQSKAMVR